MASAIPVIIEDHNYITTRLEHVSEVETRFHRSLLLAETRIMSSRVNFLRYFQDYLPSVSFAVEDIRQANDLLIRASDLVDQPDGKQAITAVSKQLNDYKTLMLSVQSDVLEGKQSEVTRKAFLALKSGNDITQLIERIVHDSENRMAITTQLTRTEIKKRLMVIIAGVVFVLLLSLLLAGFLSRSITRPVSDLRKGAEEFGLGQITARIPSYGKDELSLLARTFNTIAEQLQQSFSTLRQSEIELRAHRDHLEDLVAERTTEISKANEQLKLEITQRKRIEEQLRENEKRMRSVLEVSPVGISIYDETGKCIEANDSLANILGAAKTQVIGQNYNDLESWKKSGLLKEAKHALQEKSIKRHIINVESTFGKMVRLDCHLSPFPSGNLLLMVNDMTKQHELQDQLQQAQKLESIGMLAGGLAHDFNNLLSIIAGNIDLARYDIKPENQVYEYLKAAKNASLRAEELTKQLITFSKGGEPVKTVGSITDLLKNTASRTIEESNVACDFSLSKDLWLVEFDKSQMRHVIKNLMNNAMEAMPSGGSIHVMAENFEMDTGAKKTDLPFSEGNYVKISIQDQGVGIPEASLSKIFDPYFSTKEMGAQKGMGLGLSTTYSIIKKHDGHITVESEIGKGTIVTLYLLAYQKDIKDLKHVETPEPEKPASPTGRILVMDDEAMIRSLSRQLLSRLGYDSEVAKDGNEAVELYKKAKAVGNVFDVVILDLSVKIGMGGKDAVKQLIAIDPEVKVIVSSGYSNDPVMSNFEKYGFIEKLVKPYAMKDLNDIINKVLMGIPGNH
ncbi:MAG: response regulator [Desulfobacterales bacterium]|nr:MAG: response regulator [Desulfobacterales bacterium]